MDQHPFQRVTPESVGLHSDDISWLVDALSNSDTEMHSLMIMRQGQICAEGWWAPYAPDIVHGLQSHTKTYAATAVGIAVTQGLVGLGDRVIDLFPEFAPPQPDENLRLLTVRDVLCMGCGMATMPPPGKDWIRDFLATPVVDRPGTTFMYNSLGSSLLCAMVSRVSGRSCQAFMKTELFDKIGIDSGHLLWEYMLDGTEAGGGGLYATTEDNLRLMKLYADGGVWQGERILSADYVRQAISVQNASATEAIGNPTAMDNFLGYGFQIWMCKPQGAYRADGAMGQFTLVIPSHDMIIAITETATGAHWGQQTLDLVWQYLDRIGLGKLPLPADLNASSQLAAKMSKLSLKLPPNSKPGSLAPKINNRPFLMTGDSFQFGLATGSWMTGQPPASDIHSFSFRFTDLGCQLRISQDGRDFDLKIAMDGSRAHNEIDLYTTPIVLLSGVWLDDQTLEIRARWIQTCYEKAITFKFADAYSVTVSVSIAVGGGTPFVAGEEKQDLPATCFTTIGS